MFPQILGTHLRDEREVREIHAALGVGRLVLAAELGHTAVIDLEEARHVRRRTARHDHVIRGDLPDLRKRLDSVTGPGLDDGMLDRPGKGRSWEPGGGRSGGWHAVLDESENVLLGHAAGEAGAGNAGDVDLMLRSDLADQRRGLAAQALLGGLDAPVPFRGNGGGGAGAAAAGGTAPPGAAGARWAPATGGAVTTAAGARAAAEGAAVVAALL